MEESAETRFRFENYSQSVLSTTPKASILESSLDRNFMPRITNRHISFGSPSKFLNTTSFATSQSTTIKTPVSRKSAPLIKNSALTNLKKLEKKFSKISQEFDEKNNTGRTNMLDISWEYKDNYLDTGKESLKDSKFLLSTDGANFANHIPEDFEYNEIPTLR